MSDARTYGLHGLPALIGTLLSIMEPVLILVMGILVLLIGLTLLLPIFRMNQLVG